MDASDWIGIASIVATTAVSIISVVIAVKALRQTSQIIEDEGRPYVTIHYKVVVCGLSSGYFVLKNYGRSGANIKRFEFDQRLEDSNRLAQNYNRPQFPKLEGMFLAPGQSQLVEYMPSNIPSGTFTFNIVYTGGSKEYCERVDIDVAAISSLILSYSTPSNMSNDLKAISIDLQEIIRQLL